MTCWILECQRSASVADAKNLTRRAPGAGQADDAAELPGPRRQGHTIFKRIFDLRADLSYTRARHDAVWLRWRGGKMGGRRWTGGTLAHVAAAVLPAF